MADGRCLMAVHAHPDDEVFSTGGILARYAADGARVVVVYCTQGEEGEIHHPDLDPEEAKERLGAIRETEAREAARILGIGEVYFLGYRDSGMRDTPSNANPDAFTNAAMEEATARLLTIMRKEQPQVLVTYDEEGGYGHPDHIMANRITVEAYDAAHGEPWGPDKLYYAARSREGFRLQVEGMREHGVTVPWVKDDFNFDEYGLPDSEITAHIDVSPYMGLKQRALAVHRTQIPEDFFYLRLPSDLLGKYAGVEYFQRIRPPHRPGEREEDLFEDTRPREAVA
jgi:N-acetyl-1-D-myo-inositol-2-amino-2-deoxy-alpha-D-glucopyranoside deacetylase